MPEAKLIKALEREGFFLEFPSYRSREEIVIAVLREGNERLLLSLPLLLRDSFDYQKIVSLITRKEKHLLDKAILISQKIYQKEDIQNELEAVIKKHKIRGKFSKNEFDEFYAAFREAQFTRNREEQKNIEKQSQLRLNLDLQKSLRTLFSPAKLRIMKSIFNHQLLTNTELKYYYKAISPLNKAILNHSLQEYVRVIEIAKKHTNKMMQSS